MQRQRLVFQITGVMFLFLIVMVLQGCITVKCPCPGEMPCPPDGAPCAKHKSQAGETTEGGGNTCTAGQGTVCNVNGSQCTTAAGDPGTCHTRWVNNKCQCMCEAS
jgi:hypothetical protein